MLTDAEIEEYQTAIISYCLGPGSAYVRHRHIWKLLSRLGAIKENRDA